MNTRYPDYKTYRALYLKYFNGRDPSELLALARPLHDMRVLDICSGEGRLSIGALTQGAREVLALDSTLEMIPPELPCTRGIRVLVQDARDALSDLRTCGEKFDRIVCAQAVNYWLNKETAELVSDVLAPRGIFVFNTFNQKPADERRIVEYELEGQKFAEITWMTGDVVCHIQICDGLTPHYTCFRWLSPETLRTVFEPHFTCTEHRDGKTSLYRCEKK